MRRHAATSTINAASLEQEGVVVEKDAEVVRSFLLLLAACCLLRARSHRVQRCSSVGTLLEPAWPVGVPVPSFSLTPATAAIDP